MRVQWLKAMMAATFLCSGFVSCSRHQGDSTGSKADGADADGWRPTAEAITAANSQKKAPFIIARTSQPRASDYDLNPRAAADAHQKQPTDSAPNEAGSEDDPALGDIAKLPPLPMPKLGSGDEAEQFGLAEWDRMARGELHIKRIRY
jgi:hypothetical protein